MASLILKDGTKFLVHYLESYPIVISNGKILDDWSCNSDEKTIEPIYLEVKDEDGNICYFDFDLVSPYSEFGVTNCGGYREFRIYDFHNAVLEIENKKYIFKLY